MCPRIHLPHQPGALRKLCQVIEAGAANIVETHHGRAYYGVNLGDTVIDITMETRGARHIERLMESLRSAGYQHERIV